MVKYKNKNTHRGGNFDTIISMGVGGVVLAVSLFIIYYIVGAWIIDLSGDDITWTHLQGLFIFIWIFFMYGIYNNKIEREH